MARMFLWLGIHDEERSRERMKRLMTFSTVGDEPT